MLNLIETGWTKLKIAFDVKDPLQPTGKSFDLPENFHELNQHTRRQLTICNLFSNHGQTIEEITQCFNATRSQVIAVLINEGLLKEQRRRAERQIKNGRRRIDRVPSESFNRLVFPETKVSG